MTAHALFSNAAPSTVLMNPAWNEPSGLELAFDPVTARRTGPTRSRGRDPIIGAGDVMVGLARAERPRDTTHAPLDQSTRAWKMGTAVALFVLTAAGALCHLV